MDIKGIIFDLDGTLLHTLPDIAWSMNQVLAGENLPQHSVEDYAMMVGGGIAKLVEAALPGDYNQPERIQDLVSETQKVYKDNLIRETKLYPQIPDILNYCESIGVKMAVFSNKPHPLCQILAQRFLSDWPFDIILGANGGFPRKPQPHGLYYIAHAWNISREKLLLVGDSQADILCAKKAGVKSLAVGWGYRKPEILQQENPDHFVGQTPEFLEFFKKHLKNPIKIP